MTWPLTAWAAARVRSRQVMLTPPAEAARAVQRAVPDAQFTIARLDDGVTEDEGAVSWDLDRLIGAGGLPSGLVSRRPAAR